MIGPQLPGTGASGVVMCDGLVVAEWGDPHVPEMAFSATNAGHWRGVTGSTAIRAEGMSGA